MSLSNLQAIGRLQAQPPDPPAMAKLLQAARQNLADARVEQISTSNRFRTLAARGDAALALAILDRLDQQDVHTDTL